MNKQRMYEVGNSKFHLGLISAFNAYAYDKTTDLLTMERAKYKNRAHCLLQVDYHESPHVLNC